MSDKEAQQCNTNTTINIMSVHVNHASERAPTPPGMSTTSHRMELRATSYWSQTEARNSLMGAYQQKPELRTLKVYKVQVVQWVARQWRYRHMTECLLFCTHILLLALMNRQNNDKLDIAGFGS